jgi:hypothetical protein
LIGAAVGGWLGSKGGEMVGEAVMSTPAGKAAAPGVKATTENDKFLAAAKGVTNTPAASTVTTMSTGYKATPPQAPKVEAPATVKEAQAKFETSLSTLKTTVMDSNKFGPDLLSTMRAHLSKQDEILLAMKENLDINQRLLTQAQS